MDLLNKPVEAARLTAAVAAACERSAAAWTDRQEKRLLQHRFDTLTPRDATSRGSWAVVRLELWRGVTNDAGRKTLRRYEALLPDYEMSTADWTRAMQLADRARTSGVTVPPADLLIVACANIHGLGVAHDDTHFDELLKLEA